MREKDKIICTNHHVHTFSIAKQCIKMDITFFLQHVLAVHTVKVVRRDVSVMAVLVIRRQANVCVWQAEQATSVLNVRYTLCCNTIMTLVLYYNESSKVTLQSNGNVDGQLQIGSACTIK